MGTYTSNFKFYKPDPDEFVDVDQDLNYNWDIADEAVRRLMEYEYTSQPFPDMSTMRTNRAKFFRIYSNSLVEYFKSSNLWWQDPNGFVASFQPGLSWFSEGYNFSPVNYDISARLVKKSGASTSMVEWSGAFWELGGPMELNTNVTVIPAGGFPSTLRPTVNKYFDVWCGNTSADFSMARLLFGADGSLQFKRYGANPSSGTSNENRIEVTGCVYNVEVAGT